MPQDAGPPIPRPPADDPRSDRGAGLRLHERLSGREFQVLRMLGSGRTVSQAADRLRLSVKTVSTYRSRVLAKMSLRTNEELAHYAARNGIVEREPQ